MLCYIMVCSMIGGISVSVTTGLGAAIVTSVQGDNQVRPCACAREGTAEHKPWYSSNSGLRTFSSDSSSSPSVRHAPLPVPVIGSSHAPVRASLVTEVFYLNKALALFNTGASLLTPLLPRVV